MNAYRLASVLMTKDFPDFYEEKKAIWVSTSEKKY